MLCDVELFLWRDHVTPWYCWRGTAQGQDRDNPLSTATILPAAQNLLATIWPLIKIFRSLVGLDTYHGLQLR